MHETQATGDEVERLRGHVEQLQHALDSRVGIEQAKGILAERYRFTLDDAFLLLRYSARRNRTNIHELAAQVVPGRTTPRQIVVAAAHQQRWRAVAQRERADALRERASEQAGRVGAGDSDRPQP
jgi:hypothetical protein